LKKGFGKELVRELDLGHILRQIGFRKDIYGSSFS
jgi:hypothetical protein